VLIQRAGEQHDVAFDRTAPGRKRLLDSHEGTGTIVLDVRTPAEYASGHLPAAQNIDIEGSDFVTGIASLDKNAAYAVYCRSGNRSGAALEQMTAAGFTHVYDLAGGIGAWQNMGGPMATG
jgi:phage shock protein E